MKNMHTIKFFAHKFRMQTIAFFKPVSSLKNSIAHKSKKQGFTYKVITAMQLSQDWYRALHRMVLLTYSQCIATLYPKPQIMQILQQALA
jgi:hypothetical protein